LFQACLFRAELTDTGKHLVATSRRRFLRGGGALVGGAVVAGGLAGSKASAATENAVAVGSDWNESLIISTN
jgi:O-acetylhomoserine/O-acetylserine sulfhydrylase-like pyridoxal-dependent enzyme